MFENANIESEFGVSYYHLKLVRTLEIPKFAIYKVNKKVIIYPKLSYVVVTENGYRLPITQDSKKNAMLRQSDTTTHYNTPLSS